MMNDFVLQFVHNDELVLLQTVPSLQQVDSADNDDILLTLDGNECIAIFKKLKIRLKFTYISGTRTYVDYELTSIPKELCEKAYGHLGSCDLNRDNDKEAGPDECK